MDDDRRFDGKWVLETNTNLPSAEVALKYKELWQVELVFYGKYIVMQRCSILKFKHFGHTVKTL